MRSPKDDEKGAAAILVAASLLFLLGMAAIAVDVSGFYQDARVGQTTADMACLAGVADLPGDAAAAFTHAGAYAKANWPEMTGITMNVAGDTGTIDDGAGNVITLQTPVGGDPEKMKVTIVDRSPTFFGRVFGAQSVDIRQEATCVVDTTSSGGGGMPFGILPGGFGGGLFGPNPCGSSSGNCGSLFIERDDVSGAGPTLVKNIAEGSDRVLAPWLGSSLGADNCSGVSAGDTCHIVETDTGVSAGQLGDGFVERLRDDPGATCTFTDSSVTMNCDTPAQILGASPTPLATAFGTPPAWWEPSLYGSWPPSPTVHFYYDGVIAKCDSPRLGFVPIVSEDMNWDIGDPNPGWPSGHKDMKIVGLVDIILTDPNDSSDFQGSGNLKKAGAVVMWYGPNARCVDGSPYGVINGVTGTPIRSVKLVAG